MKHKKLNWNQLYYFTKVAEANSIKVAAQKFDLSASTLSEQIKLLEESLQVKLFHRNNRLLTLTTAGEHLYQRIRLLFENGQRIVDYVSPLKLGTYPIWVGLVPNSIISYAHDFLSDFLSLSGNINLNCSNVKHEELEKKIIEGVIDFGFSTQKSDFKDITSTIITEQTVGFYVSQKYQKLKLHECFKILPLLMCNADNYENSTIERILEEAGMAPVSTITADSFELIKKLCSQGKGIGVFPKSAQDQLMAYDIHRIKNTNMANINKKLYLLYSSRNKNLEAIQFISIMSKTLSTIKE